MAERKKFNGFEFLYLFGEIYFCISGEIYFCISLEK